jgi:flagellar motility protein MotE (MotC chaperone)
MSSFLDRLRAALRRERADVAEAWDDAKARLDGAMDRREAELDATPEARLAQVQRDIDASSDALEEVRRKIEGTAAPAPRPETPTGPERGPTDG